MPPRQRALSTHPPGSASSCRPTDEVAGAPTPRSDASGLCRWPRLRQRIGTADTQPGTDRCAPPISGSLHTTNLHRCWRVLVVWRAAAAMDASAALAMERIAPVRVHLGSRYDPASPGGGDLAAVSRRRLAHRYAVPATASPPRHGAPRPHAGWHRPAAPGTALDDRAVRALDPGYLRALPNLARQPPISHGARTRLQRQRGSLPAPDAPVPAVADGGGVSTTAQLGRGTRSG